MIDFSFLVLRQAMRSFACQVTATPKDGSAPYDAQGSYSFKPVQIPLEEGGFHSTNQPALGIRLADWSPAPQQEDRLVRKAGTPAVPGALPDGTWSIVDVVPDGQGGADLWLRECAAS